MNSLICPLRVSISVKRSITVRSMSNLEATDKPRHCSYTASGNKSRASRSVLHEIANADPTLITQSDSKSFNYALRPINHPY